MSDFQQAPHTFNPTILREYDIRGKLDSSLSAQDAFSIGCAFGSMLIRRGGKTASVGYDGRPSSPIFADALCAGLQSTGVDVEMIGIGPSPMLYFAVKNGKRDGGIMVTGSHNPPEYNGFKMMFQNESVYGAMVTEIGRISAEADFEQGEGTRTDNDVSEDYVARLLQDYSTGTGFKIAWDNGNGAAGNVLQRLVKDLPGEHALLYEDIDGNFPNHHPDPTVDANMQDVRDLVLKGGFDIGIGFDGDGDRIGVVDEKGNILKCDTLMMIWARTILAKNKGAPIVGEVKCSQVLFDEIKRMGGEPIMWKTGHSHIKSKMAELNAPLAGELSGHIFFADTYYGYDDALYAAIRLLNVMAEEGKTLSELTEHLPQLYSTPEIRFEVDETEKFGIIEKLVADLKSRQDEDFEIIDIDGARVNTEDGWWLLRASNTQNVLGTRAEAKSPEGLKRLKSMIQTEIQKYGYSVPFDEE